MDGEGEIEADTLEDGEMDEEKLVELLGDCDADGDGESEGLRLGDSLPDGLALALGLSEWESDAEGESDDSPVPAGVVSDSRNRHAT